MFPPVERGSSGETRPPPPQPPYFPAGRAGFDQRNARAIDDAPIARDAHRFDVRRRQKRSVARVKAPKRDEVIAAVPHSDRVRTEADRNLRRLQRRAVRAVCADKNARGDRYEIETVELLRPRHELRPPTRGDAADRSELGAGGRNETRRTERDFGGVNGGCEEESGDQEQPGQGHASNTANSGNASTSSAKTKSRILSHQRPAAGLRGNPRGDPTVCA